MTSSTHNAEIYGSYAIVAHYTSGVRILDISDPENPVETAWYDTRPQDNSTQFEGCWAAYLLPSGKIIASDISNGLFVIRATNLTNFTNIKTNIPEEFSLYQNFPNPFNRKLLLSLTFRNQVMLKWSCTILKELSFQRF
ncbi:MAG: hypothetical protein IPM38_19175 [Ignavibacteria bacterium]|nr:hypothetical protein [Ignavibacteria bacterium]